MMKAVPLQVMFLGTCRMHDPAHILLENENYNVRTTPHRLHTTSQTLQFIRHILNGNIYSPEMAHLISDFASIKIFEEDVTREDVLADLEPLRRFWSGCHAFVIEISALREHHALLDGEKIIVNNFSSRDQEKHKDRIAENARRGTSWPVLPIDFETSSPSRAHRQMAEIKKALNRPIIWVSHQRPPSDDPKYEIVNKVRLHLSETLRTGAEALNDQFFDPSTVASEMGQEFFFEKGGNDLDHLTPEAAHILAGRYGSMLQSLVGRQVA
ncbi:hypothetical protein [Erythrobacter rubeus]|uniref:SGNH/GDSL hydrolase family protein n=1 Tax=Erythrobacter rubeus TaxID=2760803 RepID=A0ABR8KLN7_9SPHN|nr:hypothetical protein [Erythrobacter rubeus]MBD2841358.1 hypothetical protein [Erythrobacter rubeus]